MLVKYVYILVARNNIADAPKTFFDYLVTLFLFKPFHHLIDFLKVAIWNELLSNIVTIVKCH